MELVSFAILLLAGMFFKLIGHPGIAKFLWIMSILIIAYIFISIKKHGSYKAWKEAEKAKLIAYEKEREEKKKENESLEKKADDGIPEPKPEKNKDTYMLGKYRKRQEEAHDFEGLFYPDIGDHELPSGYCNIPVPSYVVYDLETTGLTPTHDEILEIGAIRIVNDDITGVFHEYICPSCVISDGITKINGITNDMVKGCRSINEVLPDFIAFTERLPMVAYNAEFDYSFLKESQLKIDGKRFARKHYCAMKTYIKYYKDINLEKPRRYKLSDAVGDILGTRYYNEFIKTNHKSLVDTSATQFIFESIGGMLSR